MAESQKCPQCGSTLPPDAPHGVCPRCVLGLGLPGESTADVTAPLASRFALPTNEELVSLFPGLEILGLVGQGGMGAVYKARQPHLDRIVALKLLPPEVGRDPTFAERFAREARTLARLSHNNIVHIHDSGQAGGLFYFIMEFIDGVNLRQAMLAGQITPEKALAIVPQICDALQYAHEEGVIHRDIKPENVLLDKRGRIKVADFGLAKLVGNTPADFTLTGTSQAMGTLHYMAPEQMDQPQSVDHRADIYSLGVVFYELLTGRLPLGRFALPSEKLQIDIRLDEVVLKTLEREPERRYQRVSEVKTDMETISRAPAAMPQRATAAFGPPPRPAADSPWRMGPPAGVMVVFGLLMLAATIVLFLCGGVYSVLGNVSFATFLPIAAAAAVGLTTAILMIVVGLTIARQSAPGEQAAGRAALSPEEFEAAKRRVRGPALGMLLVALLNCLPFLVLFFSDGGVLFGATMWARILIALPAVVAAGIVICGAFSMRDLRWYPLAIVASIVVLAPCHFAFLLGIPVGIWALVVLSRADTWQAFQARSGRIAVAGGKASSLPAGQPAWTPLVLVAFCVGIPLMFIAALVMLRLWATPYSAEFSPAHESTYAHGHALEATKEVSPPIPPEAVTWGATGPQLGPLLSLHGGFSKEQLEKLDKALATTYQEYLAAERDHTTRKTNELGHSVITITGFPKEMGEIENRFWTEADAIVTDNSHRGTLRYSLKFPGDIFRYGQSGTTIEMWRSGTWYHVKSGFGSDYSWPELPRIYQGLWQPPEPEQKQ